MWQRLLKATVTKLFQIDLADLADLYFVTLNKKQTFGSFRFLPPSDDRGGRGCVSDSSATTQLLLPSCFCFFIEHLLSFLMDGVADFPLYCRGVYLDCSPTPQLTPPLVRVVTLIYQLHTLALDLIALLHIILKCIFQQKKLSWLQKIPRSSKCLGVLLKYEPLFQRNSLSFIFYQGKHKNIYKSSSVCVKNSMQRKELAGIYVYLCLCLYLLCKFIVGRNLIFLG